MVVQGESAGQVLRDPARDRPRWADLPRVQQGAIVALGAAEVVLTTIAVVDLKRRPRRQVRGPKALWALSLGVQPFGPVAYLLLGRRR
jgi:hypothetical protein